MHEADSSAPPKVMILNDLPHAVELYWSALSHLQNVLEDIRGADGRHAYLTALRLRLIAIVASIDAIGRTGRVGGHDGHGAAIAMERGLPFFAIDAATLAELAGFTGHAMSPDALQSRLIALGERLIASFPGHLPEAQDSGGQRQVLGAMRTWSAAATVTGADLHFLGDRLKEI